MLNIIKARLNQHKKEDGNTLIEILAVVALLSILVAISLPLLYSTKQSAREATLKEDIRRVANLVDASFTPETGYMTTLDGVNFSPDNELTLYTIANTVSNTSIPAASQGNIGSNKPAIERPLTIEEYLSVNKFNSNTSYANWNINDVSKKFGGGNIQYAYAYTGNQMSTPTLTNVCNNVVSLNPLSGTAGMGKNNCYALTHNEKLTEALQNIQVIPYTVSTTPSATSGNSFGSYTFIPEAYYVVIATANSYSNELYDGFATAGSDIVVYEITPNANIVSNKPVLSCLQGTQMGIKTEYTWNGYNLCGSLATTSNQTQDSFWTVMSVPEAPTSLQPAVAKEGTLGGYCLEGHNTLMLENEAWWHIDSTTDALTAGRCDIKWK